MKALVLAAMLLCTFSAKADFPDKMIRLIVPFPAGTVTDIVGRKVADEMRKDLNQIVMVENKPGAFGVIGGQALLAAPADGYTMMLVGVTTAASNVTLLKSLPFDPIRDFSPIGFVAEFPFFLVARPGLPINNLADLVTYGRQNPGKLTFASGASSSQVAAAQLASMLGIKTTPVLYLSAAKALTDVMGERVDLLMADVALGAPQARAGKVKGLGVSSRERFALAPDVPTLHEAGALGYEMIVWFGLVSAAKVPTEITAKLSASLIRALKNESLGKSFEAQGLVVRTSTASEFGEFMKSEVKRWAKMIKDAGIEAQ